MTTIGLVLRQVANDRRDNDALTTTITSDIDAITTVTISGSEAITTLTVFSADGEPVTAELTLSVGDTALPNPSAYTGTSLTTPLTSSVPSATNAAGSASRHALPLKPAVPIVCGVIGALIIVLVIALLALRRSIHRLERNLSAIVHGCATALPPTEISASEWDSPPHEGNIYDIPTQSLSPRSTPTQNPQAPDDLRLAVKSAPKESQTENPEQAVIYSPIAVADPFSTSRQLIVNGTQDLEGTPLGVLAREVELVSAARTTEEEDQWPPPSYLEAVGWSAAPNPL
ncbi:hypothetical protein PUNSTDRAFT_136408 [Punctularia strigosozonata HHB-11173 SS5]|uniref:uncharacterized protein n=1 Tax=Punctularia strigosozonata (strain HHB-11173) TaxID=741275 RepID=UPI0004417CB1|nr:uncharacterized protein PUNSTDRAFT_136408 [Punctularia strigosozonata HHB-11173 SS5]EIN06555.1 hypothetical protein PUNSTDRAFT_136408 [Punctularia strigosozonata HHB-11173 SS5]